MNLIEESRIIEIIEFGTAEQKYILEKTLLAKKELLEKYLAKLK